MKYFTIFFASITVLMWSNLLSGETAPSIQWQKCFGGSSNDQALSIRQTSDGGFIVAGGSLSNDGDVSENHGNYDAWIVKLDPSGNLQWQKSFGGVGSDEAISIEQTTDGGYIFVGTSNSIINDTLGNLGPFNYWIVKLDSDGNLQWQKSFGGSAGQYAEDIQQTTDKGFIVAGWSTSNDGDVSGNHGDQDYWIIKLDSLGNLLWQKSLGGSSPDEAYSVKQTYDGGFIVAGYTESNDDDVSGNQGIDDYWIVKLDSNGNILWQKCFGGTSYNEAYSVQQTADSGIAVAGWASTNDIDYLVIKLDRDGNLIWEKYLGGSGYNQSDFATFVDTTSDNGLIVIGYSFSTHGQTTGNHGLCDYWVVRLKPNGQILWEESLGGSNYDYGYCARQTKDGGFIIAGEATSNDGNVSGNHGQGDYWIVKLSPPGVITGTLSPIINSISLFPNPVQNQLTVNLLAPANESVIQVYDVQGRNMKENISVNEFTSGNSIQINTQQLTPGFYTIQITNNQTGQKEIEKFVKE